MILLQLGYFLKVARFTWFEGRYHRGTLDIK